MTEKKLHIEYVQRRQIDAAKWDACVSRASNRLIYAYSFYLDAMAENWDALILNDYEAVMPLTWRKKYGISYLYQPAFTPQLGIFTSDPFIENTRSGPGVSADLVYAFLAHSNRHFRFSEIFLNYANPHPILESRMNLVLDLKISYKELAAGYRKDLVKNLKLVERLSFSYVQSNDLNDILDLHENLYKHRMRDTKRADYAHFSNLCIFLQDRGRLILRVVKDRQQEVLATALLPRDGDRIYLLQSSTTPAGRSVGANHFLLDRLIQEFAEQHLVLDFEGSGKKGIAHFYRNFGAVPEPRYFYYHNQLPGLFKLLKRRPGQIRPKP